jgi:hypothetical protein
MHISSLKASPVKKLELALIAEIAAQLDEYNSSLKVLIDDIAAKAMNPPRFVDFKERAELQPPAWYKVFKAEIDEINKRLDAVNQSLKPTPTIHQEKSLSDMINDIAAPMTRAYSEAKIDMLALGARAVDTDKQTFRLEVTCKLLKNAGPVTKEHPLASVDQTSISALKNFFTVEKIARRGYRTWSEKPHNAKWNKLLDGTPIVNDLIVCIARAIFVASKEDNFVQGSDL